jgi:hypothetical protein
MIEDACAVDISREMNHDDISKMLFSDIYQLLNSKHVFYEMMHKYYQKIKGVHKERMMKLKSESTCIGNGDFEFVCDEGKYRSSQKRKCDGLDF